jgi:hypothetical protein
MAPSVFMSFLPAEVGNWHFNLLTGGLSLDLKTPQAFLGSSITYASNLVVTLGIAVREERVPQYEVGDSVSESLNDDQLYTDDFRLRPFFAVTYRFESNPFSTGTDEGEEESEAEERPQEQPSEESADEASEPTGENDPDTEEDSESQTDDAEDPDQPE